MPDTAPLTQRQLAARLRRLQAAGPVPLGFGDAAAHPYNGPAVYLFTTPDDALRVYVGRASKLRNRLRWHANKLRGGPQDFIVKLARLRRRIAFREFPSDARSYLVRYVPLDDAGQCHDVERYAIAALEPPFNLAGRTTSGAARPARRTAPEAPLARSTPPDEFELFLDDTPENINWLVDLPAGDRSDTEEEAEEVDDQKEDSESLPPEQMAALEAVMAEVAARGGRTRCFQCKRVRKIVAYPGIDGTFRPICQSCLLAMIDEPGGDEGPGLCARCGEVKPIAGHAGLGPDTPPLCADCLREDVEGVLRAT